MDKKIVLITPGQPSSNPRLMKEAIFLSEYGYSVVVIYSYWSDWAEEQDREYINSYPKITFISVGGDPRLEKITYTITRVKHKIFRILYKFFSRSISVAGRAECRAYGEIKKACLKIKADLYITHHVGLLSVAFAAANRHKAKCGYDAEDFYRGLNEHDLHYVQRSILLEDYFIEQYDYITAASPLIADAYRHLYKKPVQVINNVFSKKFLQAPVRQTNAFPIRLFWFSQTIGKGRGIEDLLAAMACFKHGSFTLTLLGQHHPDVKLYFENYLKINGGDSSDLFFKQPVPLHEIFQISATNDIGLALEIPTKKNNQLCLANKIFTYLLAGNAVIFSNTNAHEMFWNQHKEIGFMYESGNIESLKQILADLLNNPFQLKTYRDASLHLAMNQYHWEIESDLFLKQVKAVLNFA